MKLLCIDGNSVANRAFYGIKLLSTRDGRYTNAIYGFLNIFLKLLDDYKPDAVAAAFDLRAKTFRHEMYKEYKGTRKAMPEELAQQMPVLRQLLADLGYRVVTCEGYEADDILGTLAAACEKDGDECLIATGDRDSLQLIDTGATVLLTTTHFGRGELSVMDKAAVETQYGVSPNQLIDVKALMGDSSDNVPGVAGVGEKTALALISRFGSLDGVYENIDSPEIKSGVREKLKNDRDSAYLSKKLVTISAEVPVDRDTNNYKKSAGDPHKAAETLRELEMHSVADRLGLSSAVAAEKKEQEQLTASAPGTDELKAAEKLYIVPSESGFAATDGEKAYLLDKTALKAALSNEKTKKSCYDAKALWHFALGAGTEPNGLAFDVKLAAYLLNPSASGYEPERLAAEYRVECPAECGQLPGLMALPALDEKLSSLLQDEGMTALLRDIELPLSGVLAKMENEGFLVDTAGIAKFGEELTEEINGELNEIYTLVGREFNLNSPKQLGEALFVTLGLPVVKKKKSGYSTDAETLEKLRGAHPVIDHILAYRSYQKLNSTYVQGLLRAADAGGRVHTVFNQTETRTGRISSTDPNLQNIPVRTELGGRLRRFFVAGEGNVLLDADYSQIELRVLAHMSGDEKMIAAFTGDKDIHTETASQIFRVAPQDVTPLLRRKAKAVNFGIVYGIGAFSLAKNTGVSVAEADKYIKDYLATYSGVHRYLEETVENAVKEGYVTTMYGRRRALPELANSNKGIQALGKRLAMNTPIQGTAADIIKIAMIRVQERLEKEKLDARLILQVHDELIVEASEKDADRAAMALEEEMENAALLSAPLVAEVGRGRCWYDAK